MLPPVAASSDTAFNTHDQSGIVFSAPRIEVLLSSTGVDARLSREPSIRSGSRLDIMSLSGQLQLAQGLSVVETIGALLSVSRNQGEPLADYAERITEVIAKLSSTERLSLQRALNQLMQGFTLRLLTEILKNPVGPEATRLALRLEAAAYLERDPVARQVVTSYRQNGGAEAQPPTGSRANAPAIAPAGGPRQAGASTMGADPPLAPREVHEEASALSTSRSPAVDRRQDPDETAATPARRAGAKTVPDAPGPGRQMTTTPLPAQPEPAGRMAIAAQAAGTTSPIEPASPEGNASSADAAGLGAAGTNSAADESADDVTYDAPALARQIQAETEPASPASSARLTAPGQPLRSQAAEAPGPVQLTVAVVISEPVPVAWLSGLYADEGGASWGLANAALPTPDESAETAQAPDAKAKTAAGSDAGPASNARSATPSAPLTAAQALPGAGGPASGAAPAATQPTAMMLQAQAAQGVLRDGLMPAYVPYAPAGGIAEKPKPLVSAIEAEDDRREGGGRSGGGAKSSDDREDKQRHAETELSAADDEDGLQDLVPALEITAAEELAPQDAPSGGDDAQAYYRRMAGW
ncbi:hypothetical protein [Rhizobium sp. SGZ-381]|uniref:hypothetical protein n=1 Tax=Rhizobium sp. SGZ-381 TaxID=3342800 RepID=UPI0036728FDA